MLASAGKSSSKGEGASWEICEANVLRCMQARVKCKEVKVRQYITEYYNEKV